MKISKKLKRELYQQIHDDIMAVRFDLRSKYNLDIPGTPLYYVENMLQELATVAPNNAVNIFSKEKMKRDV